MKTKIISMIALSFSACSLLFAGEYKSPSIGFKKVSPTETVAKAEEFNEDYKVEPAVKTDRQIASESDSDREPSSLLTDEEKEKEDKKEDSVEPQPWRYNKNQFQSNIEH